jgi:hypothetical protein
MKTVLGILLVLFFGVSNNSFAQMKKADKIVPREAKMEEKTVQKVTVSESSNHPNNSPQQLGNTLDSSAEKSIENEVKEQVSVQTINGIKTVTVTRFENGSQTVMVLKGAEAEAKIRDFESKGGQVRELNSLKRAPAPRVPKN